MWKSPINFPITIDFRTVLFSTCYLVDTDRVEHGSLQSELVTPVTTLVRRLWVCSPPSTILLIVISSSFLGNHIGLRPYFLQDTYWIRKLYISYHILETILYEFIITLLERIVLLIGIDHTSFRQGCLFNCLSELNFIDIVKEIRVFWLVQSYHIPWTFLHFSDGSTGELIVVSQVNGYTEVWGKLIQDNCNTLLKEDSHLLKNLLWHYFFNLNFLFLGNILNINGHTKIWHNKSRNA